MLFYWNAILGFLIGAFVGKFMGLIVNELPKILLAEDLDGGEPRDIFKGINKKPKCLNCNIEVSWSDNLPIIGYLATQGRCKHCHHPSNFRNFLLEVMVALLFGILMLCFPFNAPLLFVLIISCLLICCFITDFEHGILPDQFTLAIVWVGLIGSLFPIFITPRESIIGAVAGYGIFWCFNELYRSFRGFDGMFPGDFKLNAGIGACVGLKWLMPILLLSFLFLLSITVLQLLASKKKEYANFLYKEAPYGCYSSIVTGGALCLLLNGAMH